MGELFGELRFRKVEFEPPPPPIFSMTTPNFLTPYFTFQLTWERVTFVLREESYAKFNSPMLVERNHREALSSEEL
jgi:hypothetical protein